MSNGAIFSLYFNKPFNKLSACRIDSTYTYNNVEFFKGEVRSVGHTEFSGRMSHVVDPIEAAKLSNAYGANIKEAFRFLDELINESKEQSCEKNQP